MAYPAVELVNRAWYLSGIIARDQENVPGSYGTEGLYLLNALLDFKASDLPLIPYFRVYDFVLTAGEEVYFIPDLYEIETFTFNIGPVRFPTTSINRAKYFGTGRVDNITSLPFSWHLERVKGGSNLRLYFLPNTNYPAQIVGKFALTEVTQNQDISLVYDGFYIEYLRYALAKMMCDEWDVEFAPSKMETLKIYEKKLMYISPPDLTVNKVPLLANKTSLNWAIANLSQGYIP